jgi:acetyl/propionyl-CoA carboxylase alpha subunit
MADAMDALGDKQKCRETAARLSPAIPTVPGGGGRGFDSAAALLEVARSIGFPVLLK